MSLTVATLIPGLILLTLGVPLLLGNSLVGAALKSFPRSTAAAFKCVPDFLSVRGLCALMLLAATPLLDAAYMEWAKPQRLLMVSVVYAGIAAAIWLGAQPWRMRDWLNWLFIVPGRAKIAGGIAAGYGLLLCGVAFTY